ncbi:GNAT family N-acetyltransferase [Achromobacter sp. Marseille-Q0513]|nr:GNAT family N-acetyltransferase [Achromobacter sp. Marseille-Q0513]
MLESALPDTFVTERLRATRMAETHGPFVAAMHADVALMATMGGTRDAAASRRYLLQNTEHWSRHGFGMYVLNDRRSGALVGRAGLKRIASEAGAHDGAFAAEIAYAFVPSAWGLGYAGEIARALVAMGFGLLELPGMMATVLASNGASRRVLEKAGLRCAGQAPSATGEPKLRYELDRAQWQAGQPVATGSDRCGMPGGAAPER